MTILKSSYWIFRAGCNSRPAV